MVLVLANYYDLLHTSLICNVSLHADNNAKRAMRQK